MFPISRICRLDRVMCFGSLINLRKQCGEAFGIIGVPFDKGQKRHGVSQGPTVLRELGLIERLLEKGCNITDHGDIHYSIVERNEEVPNMHHLEHIAACHKELSQKVVDVMNLQQMCLTIGGDHSIGIGTIDGHQKAKKDLAVIWVDAHADLNTHSTSPSGNVHGMPVALLCKELEDYWPYLPGMDWQMPQISINDIAYIGLRDLDPYERAIIDKFRIPAFGMEEIERLGIFEVLRLVLKEIDPMNKRSIHLSFDIDALDSLEAPSTGTAVRGGLTLREGIQIIEECYRTGRLNAVDLVEFNPLVGTERDVYKTGMAIILLAKAACGITRSGMYLPKCQQVVIESLQKHVKKEEE